MRIFYQSKGKYQGDHNIYDTREEFIEKMPGIKWHLWGRELEDTIQTGDWVEAMDGYIIQCLMTKKMNNVVIHRFPVGSFYTYKLKNGTLKWAKLFAQMTNIYPSRLGNTPEQVDFSQKSKFALLIAAGVPPVNAYTQAGFKYQQSLNVLKSKIARLLMDEDVHLVVQTNYDKYLARLQNDPDFTDEKMVGYVKEFMTNVRKGSMVHLQSLIPLLQLTGKIPREETKTRRKEIEEANYNEPPPSP